MLSEADQYPVVTGSGQERCYPVIQPDHCLFHKPQKPFQHPHSNTRASPTGLQRKWEIKLQFYCSGCFVSEFIKCQLRTPISISSNSAFSFSQKSLLNWWVKLVYDPSSGNYSNLEQISKGCQRSCQQCSPTFSAPTVSSLSGWRQR